MTNENPFLVNNNVTESIASTSTISTNNGSNENSNESESILSNSSLGKRVYRYDEDHEEPDEVEEVNINYNRHPLLERYCTLLLKLQDHPVEEESQRARHISKMLKWHVVDQRIFNEAGWMEKHHSYSVSKPSFCLKLVSDVFKQTSNNQLHQAEQLIQNKIELEIVITHYPSSHQL